MSKPALTSLRTSLRNDLSSIPAAACSACGGWTGFGGMSQHRLAHKPVLGRTGCDCPGSERASKRGAARARLDADGSAKPLTRLVGHVRAGDCIGGAVTPFAIESVFGGTRIAL